MSSDLPVGSVTYSVPLNEVEALAELLARGAQWADCNQITLNPKIAARLADIAAVARALRRADVAPDVAPPSAQPLHPAKVDDMGEQVVVTSPAGAARILGCARQNVSARLRRGTLAGFRDERGYWQIPVTSLEGEGTDPCP
jgi:hypothetical protein